MVIKRMCSVYQALFLLPLLHAWERGFVSTCPGQQICYSTSGGDIILSEQDLYILTEILRPAAPQWKILGLAFGFLNHELTIIECKPLLIPEGPPGYFREMLGQWLKWAPPNHSPPTVESLALTLQSSGHEDLAVKLRTSFLQRKGRKVQCELSRVVS